MDVHMQKLCHMKDSIQESDQFTDNHNSME